MTLIELLAVIVIIAIIAAIAIPAIGNIIENSRYGAAKSDASNVLSAANIYFTENPEDDSATLTELKAGYLQSAGIFDDATTETDVYVTKANPNTLTAPSLEYSGDKTIAFTGATLDAINGDTTKGSDVATVTITTTVTTTAE
ncbi:prepilin-type N-terminal cleavage/methylation domain-containing protein [Planococcus sp. MB-3u-03]